MLRCFDDQAVQRQPFPHFIAENWLDASLYHQLSNTFPDLGPSSGPTGFGLFWGDPEYEQLLAGSAAWRALFDMFQSDAFVRFMMRQFGATYRSESVRDLSSARYVPLIEDRQDKESRALRRVSKAPDELYVRVDLLQGRVGYDRGRHLDHRRRAATVLVYFGDADELEMDGGDLLLHGEDGPAIVVRPRRNLAVGFVCNNQSWHSVSPIRSQAGPRNFVQVTLSSSVDLWSALPSSTVLGRARNRLRSAFNRR